MSQWHIELLVHAEWGITLDVCCDLADFFFHQHSAVVHLIFKLKRVPSEDIFFFVFCNHNVAAVYTYDKRVLLSHR